MNTPRNDSPKVVVIGAGLAGLTSAYRLAQSGWQVCLLEKNTYPGGRAASLRKGGYLIDTGATGVGDVYTEYMALLDELGLLDKVEYASSINATLRNGKLFEVDGAHPYISGLKSGLFSWRSKFILPRLFRDVKNMGDKLNFQDVSQGHEYDNESAHDYALRRLNRELLDYFVDPILRAVVVAGAAQVSKLELMNAMNGLFSTRLLATRGGLALLPHTLAEHIEDIRYSCEVTRVDDHGEDIEVCYRAPSGESISCRADACVIASTLPEAVEVYADCTNAVLPLNDELRYVPGLCAHLGYSARTKTKSVMVLLSAHENPELTLLWLDHNKVSDRAPAGHSLLYMYYDDAVAQKAWGKSDDELVADCTAFVERVFPELANKMDMSHISRWQRAVPLPAPGIYRKMFQVRRNLDANRDSRVQLAGDYLSCVGQNTAIVYGEKAADNLIQSFGRQ